MRGLLVLLSTGCWLEFVDTANPTELDPAFYEAAIQNQGMPGVGGGSAIPFSDYDGEKVTVFGTVIGEERISIDVDVRIPDASAPGGMLGLGKILMDGPGSFELQVPMNQGTIELEAFQDRDADGPSTSDPFAHVAIDVGDEDLEVSMELEEGSFRRGGPVHQEMPAGAPGGAEVMAMVPPDPEQPDPFGEMDGPKVSVGGALYYEGSVTVDLDIFRANTALPGGREMIGKLKLSTGSYELRIPQHYGPIILEAFIDLNGNMRADPSDPMGAFSGNPLRVGDNDIWNVDIQLSIQDDGMMPVAPAPEGASGGGRGI